MSKKELTAWVLAFVVVGLLGGGSYLDLSESGF